MYFQRVCQDPEKSNHVCSSTLTSSGKHMQMPNARRYIKSVRKTQTRNYQWPRESIAILEHSLEASGGVTWRTFKKAAVSEGSRKAVGRKCRKELEISTIW